MKFGAYFYPWYGRQRWQEAKFPHQPLIGEYYSANLLAIEWQIAQMKRAGLDFLVIEFISPGDWCAPICYETIDLMLPQLRAAGIGWTFLIDNKVGSPDELVPGRDWRFEAFDELLGVLHQRGWDQGLLTTQDGAPLLFAFSPEIGEAEHLRRNHGKFAWRFPVYLPYWGSPITEWHRNAVHKIARDDLLRANMTIFELFTALGFMPFWCEHDAYILANRVGSIIPGYDDSLLGRPDPIAPHVSRADGATLVRQFAAAIANRPELVLIYSWNEYFEATNIEPSIQHGDFYVRLLARLIAQVRAGAPIAMPEDMTAPLPADPIYLSGALEHAAQRYPDRLPRWDQDDYRATVTPSGNVVESDGVARFPVHIVNTGMEPWPSARGFRIGVRAFDANDTIVREGRAEFSDGRMGAGEGRRSEAPLEISDLPAGRYSCEVGIVLEGHFWLQPPARFILDIH